MTEAAAQQTKTTSRSEKTLAECPGRPMQPCHNTTFFVNVNLHKDGTSSEPFFVCTACRVPLQWRDGAWQSIEP